MKKMFKYLVCLIVISALVVFGIDLYVVFSTKDRIVNEYSELKRYRLYCCFRSWCV